MPVADRIFCPYIIMISPKADENRSERKCWNERKIIPYDVY